MMTVPHVRMFCLALLMGGVVVTETVFSWPGVGRLLVVAVANRDLAVVQCILLLVAAFFGGAQPSDFDVDDARVAWEGDPDDWGLRRMILHYAHLCAAAGGVVGVADVAGVEDRVGVVGPVHLGRGRDELTRPRGAEACHSVAEARTAAAAEGRDGGEAVPLHGGDLRHARDAVGWLLGLHAAKAFSVSRGLALARR